VRAPELVGRGGWLNSGGVPLSLAGMRGRFVLIDFWTFCCVNCLHVLDEMRPLEDEYADVLTVVGVHSPKFAHESDHEAVAAAVERYGVNHPVLDDPDLTTWQAYTVRAWPTLVLVDPEGYIAAQFSGEGHAHALRALLDELVPVHEAKRALLRGGSPYVPPEPATTDLRFPGKVAHVPGGSFLVSDTSNHSLVELTDDLDVVVRRIGSRERGFADGDPEVARFSEPQGLVLLPSDVGGQVGYDVVVADTVNHALRGVRLADGSVRTLAGTGRQWMQGDGVDALSSPWDVAWWQDRVWVAMAGVHQLWTFDPRSNRLEVAAGTTNEGLHDGPLRSAWFAQTSGLSASPAGLWLADSETSALRRVVDGQVRTLVGTGLFDFGWRDGPAAQALFQHPLGVTALPDGSVAVCDTYNDAVRRFDPATAEMTTLAAGLREPSGAVVAGADLVVVESAAHRLTRIPLGAAAVALGGFARRTRRPVTTVAPGEVEIVVTFDPPPGQKLDDRFGPSSHLLVSAAPGALLLAGGGRGSALERTIELAPAGADGVLHIAATAASCDADSEHPACHVHQQDWGVPVRIVEDGARRLTLVLSGRP
jgi:thiol-disulfide isomerase/thioredoxin